MLFTYLTRELRRRYRQTLVISIGLAVGIGLVITVTAASAGVGLAQQEVLHALYGIGTDLTVSKPASSGSGGPTKVGFQPSGGAQPGQSFNKDVLTTGAQGTLDQSAADTIANLAHVSAVSSALQLVDLNIQGQYQPRGQAGNGSPPPPVDLNSTTIDGITVTTPNLGPITASEITKGHFFSGADATADDAIVTTSYAHQHNLSVGSTLTIDGTSFKVIGLVNPPAGSDVSIYIPLNVAQTLANLPGKVTDIYVQASNASEISAVQSEINRHLSGATVTTSASLASEITGSLSAASTIINKLGLWLSVAVLIVVFGIAGLLTISAVSRRVREFGTLKALGWRVRRVVGQVMAESLVQGVLGGILGIALGYGGAALVTHFAPPLSADNPSGLPSGGGSGQSGHALSNGGGSVGSQGIPIHLTAQVQVEALILAVCLAIAGGLIAGLFGAWRAARLRPAEALRSVE